MSSHLVSRQYSFFKETVSHVFVAASLLMIIYILMTGWVL